MPTLALTLARRLVGMLITLLASSALIFAALALVPGDPATLLAGGTKPNPAVVAAIRREYHLNDPWVVQYWRWLVGVLHGDLGRSYALHDDVSHVLASRATTTVFLVVYAGLMILAVGVATGLASTLRPGRVRAGLWLATSVAMGTPTFAVAIGLIWVFSLRLSWFPVYGSGSGPVDQAWHLTLPAIALAASLTAYVSRVTGSALSAELGSEHVQTARSRGLPTWLILRKHVLRNASGPILAVSGIVVAGLFAGTAVVEQIFSVNGLGSLLVTSAARHDLPVVQAICLLVVFLFVVVNTVVDVVNVALDPRLAVEQP